MHASTAILLVGHGTRDDAGQAEFFALAKLLEVRVAPSPVFPCFLELAEPAVDAAVFEAVARGAEEIVVAPVLLFSAGHARHDIPAALEAAIRRAADRCGRSAAWRQGGVLACHEKLVELSAERFAAALAAVPAAPPDETCLVLVGRGSRDAEATAAMHRFARLRCEVTPVGRCDVAFVAMAEPKYPDVLREAAQRGHRRIVVQPHLLFEGELLDKLRRDVAAVAECHATSQWIVAKHLGPDPRVAEAVATLCRIAAEGRRN
jgi:sirohydrochlorin ferrochelatase